MARHLKVAPERQWTAYELIACPIEIERDDGTMVRCAKQVIGCGTLKYHVDHYHSRHQQVTCPHHRCIKKRPFKSLGDYFRHYKQASGHRTFPSAPASTQEETASYDAQDETASYEAQDETTSHEEGHDEIASHEGGQDETESHEEGQAETPVDDNGYDEAMDTTVKESAPTICLYCQEPHTALTIGDHMTGVHDYDHSTDTIKCECCDARYSITGSYLHHINFTDTNDPHYKFRIRCEWCGRQMSFGCFVRHEELCKRKPTSITVADIRYSRVVGRFPEVGAAGSMPKTFALRPMVDPPVEAQLLNMPWTVPSSASASNIVRLGSEVQCVAWAAEPPSAPTPPPPPSPTLVSRIHLTPTRQLQQQVLGFSLLRRNVTTEPLEEKARV